MQELPLQKRPFKDFYHRRPLEKRTPDEISIREIWNAIYKNGTATPRAEQERLSESIYSMIVNKRTATFESPTGTGKTLAMLVASVAYLHNYKNKTKTKSFPYTQDDRDTGELYGTPKVVIAVPTKELQEQLLQDYEKHIKPVFPEHDVAVLKGRSNYIDRLCLKKHVDTLEQENNEQDKKKYKDFFHKVEQFGGDIDLLEDIAREMDIELDRFTYSPERTVFMTEEEKNQASYYFNKACEKAQRTGIVVTNHAFFVAYNWYKTKKEVRQSVMETRDLMSHLYERLTWEVKGIPFTIDNVIIDEAHKYPMAVVNILSNDISFVYLSHMAHRIAATVRKDRRKYKISVDDLYKIENYGEKIKSCADSLKTIADTLDTDYIAITHLQKEHQELLRQAVKKTCRAVRGIKTIISPARSFNYYDWKFEHVLRVLSIVDALLTGEEVYRDKVREIIGLNVRSVKKTYTAFLLSFSDVYKSPSLKVFCPFPAGGAAYIADIYNSIIALSGTMTNQKGSFYNIQKELGLLKLINRGKGIPAGDTFAGFPVKEKKMARVYLYPKNPVPFNGTLDVEDYISKVEDRVKEVIIKAKGRVLILCPAYKDTYIWYEKLKDTKKQVMLHHQGSLSSLDATGVLISATAWEGVDIDGLSDVIITRIPNVTPNDMFYYAREITTKELVAKDNDDTENAIKGVEVRIRNEKSYHAFIRLRQGMGRLIRNEKSRGNIHILDPRAYTKKDYREWFMKNYVVEEVEVI
jgi:Rad3-related DNA helicase